MPQALLRALRKPKIAIPAAVCLVVLSGVAAWLYHRQSKIRWAREQALPEIERLANSFEVGLSNYTKAYALAQQAEKYIAGDAALVRLLARTSTTIGIKTEPSGAAVYMKEYSDTEMIKEILAWLDRYLGPVK